MSTAVGRPTARIEGLDKVTGRARYSFEQPIDDAAYVWLVLSTIARGTVTAVDTSEALAAPGTLAVLWHGNAPRLGEHADAELAVLQSADVRYRGQIVAMVVATGLEAAREAASLVRVDYAEEPHDVLLTADHPELYAPEKVNPAYPTDTSRGSLDEAMAEAAFTVDHTYTTPAEFNNPMEPHASVARWVDGRLEVWDSNQGPSGVAAALATLFEVDPTRVRVITQHVGGGFGSKGTARPIVVATVMAAREVGRPVKLAATRRAMFSLVGYRTPTIQRLRLAADRDGTLLGIGHQIVEQTSRMREFAEQTGEVSRHMYASPNSLVTHRLARLDVPTPSWMRAPGEAPGMFALESAMDELASELGIDPIELRVRNEPAVDPFSGDPFGSRHYVECFREGAARFGWERREPRREGRWLIGSGVAGSVYPTYTQPSSASARREADGRYTVSIAAADIGQGGRTVLHQIAADALEIPIDRVTVRLGDSTLPQASVAGGSSGTSSWGWAVTKACRQLLSGTDTEVTVSTKDDLAGRPKLARFAYGAQFVEVRVNADTGEVRANRMLGIFATGRILNPRLARSQFIGGMTMGLSMALHESGALDPNTGSYVNHDLAEYHVAVNADVTDIEVDWLSEESDANPMGGKGIGEIGIVGTAAAVANAVAHATGVRVRDLPIIPSTLLSR